MKLSTLTTLGTVAITLGALSASAQVSLSGISYTENFNSIDSGIPAGWSVKTGATSSVLGTDVSLVTAETSWATSTGNFRNVAASTGLTSSSDVPTQGNSANRAIGIRQTGSFGDPGAAFTFNFNSTGYTNVSFSLDAMMLSVQGYSTTWSLQSSTNGTSWTTHATWSDPGTFGSTSVSSGGVISALANQSSAYIRFVALSAATGSSSRDTIAIDNFSMSFSAVPEPSTYAALLGAAALGLTLVRRRRLAA